MNRTESSLLRLPCLAFLAAGLCLSNAGTAGSPPAKPEATKTKPAPTPAPTQGPKVVRPPIYDSYTSGEKAVMDTARQCIASGRRLYLNFGTNDCELCYTASEAVQDPAFREKFFGQFIPLYIDVSPGTENAKFLESYGIDPSKGLPAMAVIEFSPRKATIAQKGEFADAAKMGPEAVRFFLSQFLTQTGTPTPAPTN